MTRIHGMCQGTGRAPDLGQGKYHCTYICIPIEDWRWDLQSLVNVKVLNIGHFAHPLPLSRVAWVTCLRRMDEKM